MGVDVAAWRKAGGPALALARLRPEPHVVDARLAREQAAAAQRRLGELAAELSALAQRLEALPAGVQLAELDAVQLRVAAIENEIPTAGLALSEARLLQGGLHDMGGAMDAVTADATQARSLAQSALGKVLSLEAIATTARSMVQTLWPQIPEIRDIALGASQTATAALEAAGSHGVVVARLRREGRQLVVSYSNGFEEVIELPDDRRLFAGTGVGTEVTRVVGTSNTMRSTVVTAAYTVADDIDLVYASGSTNYSVTLPSASLHTERVVQVKRIGTGAISIVSAAGNIDDLTTIVADTIYDSARCHAKLGKWWII